LKKDKKMSEERNRASRAVQFSAFDALKGYGELIKAGLIVKEERRELSEDVIAEIAQNLSAIKKGVTVKVTHYKDLRYQTSVGTVTGIDPTFGILTVEKEAIHFSDILSVKII